MRNTWELTPFGVEVKKRLLDIGMAQGVFCKEHGFNPKHFSLMLYGVKPMRKMREKTAKVLGISA